MITKLRNILGLSTLEENLARYNSVSEDIQYINSQTDDLSEHYYSKMSNYNHILKSDEYSDQIKKSVKTRYDNFLQDQKKIVVGLVNKRHKLEKELSSLLKNDSLNKAVQELNSIEKAKENCKSGKISKSVYNDIIKAKKGKVHYSDNFVFWNGKLLLIQRATDDTNANTWVVPGGHVDAGESHVDAAIRELQEETGLVVEETLLAGTYNNDDVMIEYYTSHIDSDTEPQLILDTAEHQSYKWIDIHKGDLDNYEFPFNMKENIKKILLPNEENTVKITKAVNLFINGAISKEVLSDIVKARSGVYENTPENRKLGRVGQKYGSKKEEVKTDRSGNYIGDGSEHHNYSVYDFKDYPQIESNVSKSETTESVYVTYKNKENFEKIVVRFSGHENNAVKFGDQLNGETASKDEILYRLGIKDRTFTPNKKISIWTRQVSKKSLAEYEESPLTIKEMYDLGAGADLSKHKGKVARGSNYLILGDTVKEEDETRPDGMGGFVRVGQFTYKDKDKLLKAFELGLISQDVLEKARTGKYADTSENRRLRRVGQPYGTKKGEDTKETKEPSKQEETDNKDGKDIPIDQHARESSETALQEAAKGGDEELRLAAKKELERRDKEEPVYEFSGKIDIISELKEKAVLELKGMTLNHAVSTLESKDFKDLSKDDKIEVWNNVKDSIIQQSELMRREQDIPEWYKEIKSKKDPNQSKKEETPPSDEQSETDTTDSAKSGGVSGGKKLTVKDKVEELSDKYKDLMTDAMSDDFSDTEKTEQFSKKQKEYARYIQRVKEFDGINKEEHLKKAQDLLGLKSEKETKDFFGDGEIIGISVEDEFVSVLMEDCYCQRGFNKGEVEMLEFILNPDLDKGQGKGSDIFYNQVNSFKNKGYKKLITDAAKSDVYNGYYTWARLGYELPEKQQYDFESRLKLTKDKDLESVKSLPELMSFHKGRKYWKEYGLRFNGVFDLSDNSRSMFILNKYMEEKKNARK